MPERRAQEKNGQSAGASGGTRTLPASGAGSRLRARFDSEVDRGREVIERVVRSRLGRWWNDTERPGLVDWALLGVILLVA